MGLSAVRIGDPYRCDRMLLLKHRRHRATRRGWRSARYGPPTQEQHDQAPRQLIVSSGLPALRRTPPQQWM